MAARWKTVRVFISSTFRDMHAERDALVKLVFPRLRQWCEARRLHLVDIDLRWGLTQAEAENGRAIEICLGEIDGSRPFFFCLLGSQYGWVPPERPHSITHMEIVYAALRDPAASEAFFYFRDPEALSGWSEAERERYGPVYFTADPADRERLAQVKREIDAAFGAAGRVFVYPARWDPEAGRITALEALGERVEADLKRAIEASFPEHVAAAADVLDPLDSENDLHLAFIASRTQMHVPDPEAQLAIGSYFEGERTVPCVLSGPVGSGKSATLAHWINTHGEAGDRTLQGGGMLLYRAVGASPASSRLHELLSNLCRELQRRFPGQAYPPLAEDPAEVIRAWPAFLEAAAAAGERIALVIDGIDQLAGSSPGFAAWIPAALPANVRLLVSALERPPNAEGADWLAVLRARGLEEIRLGPLDEPRAREIVRRLPSLYSKSLDERQAGAVLANPATRNALFLSVALQELRVFGSFERLDEAIARIPRVEHEGARVLDEAGADEALAALFGALLARLEEETAGDAPGLVPRVFGWLASAREGLAERELADLAAAALPGVPGAARNAVLQAALRQVRAYLHRKAAGGSVLIDFFHRSFREAARKRYLPRAEDLLARHAELAAYFEAVPLWVEGVPHPRKMAELAWQRLRMAGISPEAGAPLAGLLLDHAFLDAKYRAGRVFELAQEMAQAISLLPPDAALRKPLVLFEEALRRDIHFIARHREDYPQALFQCLWNTCWWYDHPAARRHLQQDAPVSVLDGVLAERLEDMLEGQAAAMPGGNWLRQLRPPATRLGEGLARVFDVYAKPVEALAWSPDGRYLVTGSSQPAIVVWDVQEGAEMYRLERVGGRVQSVAVSPDGQSFVVGLEGKVSRDTARVFSLVSGTPRFSLAAHRSRVSVVEFSRDGALVMTSSDDGTAAIWDAATGGQLARIGEEKSQSEVGRRGPAVRLVPGTKLLVRPVGQSKALELWDWSRDEQAGSFEVGAWGWSALAVSEDGSHVAGVNANDRDVWIWELPGGREVARLEGHTDWAQSVSFSKDGRLLVSAGKDGTARVWDVAGCRCLRTFSSHRAHVNAVAFSPDGRFVATGSGDSLVASNAREDDFSVHVSSVAGGGAAATELMDHGATVERLAFSPDGSTLVSSTGRRYGEESIAPVRTWSAPMLVAEGVLSTHPFNQMAFASGGDMLVAAAAGVSAWHWRARKVRELDDRDSAVSFLLSPDGCVWSRASTTLGREPTRVYELPSGRKRGTHELWPMAFSPDGRLLVASHNHDGYSSRLEIFEAAGMKRLWTVERTQGQVQTVVFSPDGRLLAASQPGQGIVVRDWQEDAELLVLAGHPSSAKALRFSNDGAYLTSACKFQVRIWRVADGTCLAVHEGQGDLDALAGDPFGPGCWPLNAASGEMQLIDRATGKLLACAPGSWHHLDSHPFEPVWAGANGRHLNGWRLERFGEPVALPEETAPTARNWLDRLGLRRWTSFR